MCRKGLWLEDEISDFHLTCWRTWLNVLLKIFQVASLQITLHVRSTISVAPLRKLMDLCLDRLTFYFLLASPAWLLSLKKKNHPSIRVNGWYFVSSTTQDLDKEVRVTDRWIHLLDGQYDSDTLHCEWVEAFPNLCCQPYCRKRRIQPTSLEVHNNSKSNPVDEASPGVTANMFIRNGRWGEEPEWESFVMFYQTGHSSLFEALRLLWHLLLKQFIVWVVYYLM